MNTIKFSKMVATGNDFVIVDNRKSQIRGSKARLARSLCDRKLSIGADGLLFLENSRKADFRMRIFNPDGSEPDMCGNGSRCIALYAKVHKIAGSNMVIEAAAGMLSAMVSKGGVRIKMTDPRAIKFFINLKIDKKTYELHYVDTGVPHVVYFINSFNKIDTFPLGRSIRYHKAFRPAGCNVNFVQVKSNNTLSIRTYERGVEAQTLACGTGATASAVMTGILKGFNSPVKVCTEGGILRIYFKNKNSKISDVFLEGEAEEVFEGQIRRF